MAQFRESFIAIAANVVSKPDFNSHLASSISVMYFSFLGSLLFGIAYAVAIRHGNSKEIASKEADFAEKHEISSELKEYITTVVEISLEIPLFIMSLYILINAMSRSGGFADYAQRLFLDELPIFLLGTLVINAFTGFRIWSCINKVIRKAFGK
jgi:hypothetical protein